MKELLDLILPQDVLSCFEVVKVTTTSDQIDIYLDEKNILPRASKAVKAFYPRFPVTWPCRLPSRSST